MKTAVAAPPNDDERRRLLSTLQALLQKRVRYELIFWEMMREGERLSRHSAHPSDRFPMPEDENS